MVLACTSALAAAPVPGGPLGRVPERLVPGVVFLKVDGLPDDVLVRATRGEARAKRSVDDVVARIARETGVTLQFSHRLPAGWGSFTLEDETAANGEHAEDTTLRMAQGLKGRAGIKSSDVNWWKRALRSPNDEFINYQWMLDQIGARAAWDINVGSSSTRVGVVDTGTLRGHEDLGGKDLTGFDFISFSDLSNDGDGRDSDWDDLGDLDFSFHGSHVAGTILASTDNGTGIAGLSWNARLVTGRALGFAGGNLDDIMSAVAWMAGDGSTEAGSLSASNRPGVVNLSLGSATLCSDFEQDVINFAVNQGVIVVAAAGNDGGPVGSPANCSGVIAVAASDAAGDLATYSSFGNEIDVVAPGGEQTFAQEDGVLSLYADWGDGNPPYIFYQGTSMAAPHVAGVVSLMLEVNPSLSTSDIIGLFQSTGGESCGGCGGRPFLRADLLLEEAGGAVAGPTEPGDLCSGVGSCSAGQVCLDLGDGERCALVCDAVDGGGCGSGFQCRGLGDGGTVCTPAGTRVEGDACGDDQFACVNGTICLSDGTDSLCYRRCDMAYGCADTQSCIEGGSFAYCDPLIPGGFTGGGGGGGGGGDGDECDPDRGNLDCPNGHGCRESSASALGGTCIFDTAGDLKVGELCEDDDECDTGLCEDGVCTTECEPDGDCRDGYTCDDDAIPGGLCEPDSCKDEDADFCEEGWSCQFSPDENYVCADVEPGLFSCSHARAAGPVPLGSLALAGAALGLLGRRRTDRRTRGAIART